MGIVSVANFSILFPKDITFQVEADKNVTTLRATLFRKKGSSMKKKEEWTASQLKQGVSFTADEDAERFEISVTASVKEDGTLTGITSFDPTPPKKNTKKAKLKADEVNERVWFFFPIK